MRGFVQISLLCLLLFCCVGCSTEKTPGANDLEQARSSYSKGFYLEAEKEYERYLQAAPQGVFRKEAWERLVEIAVSVKGEYDRAVVLLEAMYLELGDDPESGWKAMYQLGDVYSVLGKKEKAIESFEKCLLHAAEFPEKTARTQLRMARLYRDMGNYGEVADTLQLCAETAPNVEDKANCLYELAQSYSFISSWSQAKNALEKVLELSGTSDEIRALSIFLLADIYENDRHYAKAKSLLESIVDTYPNRRVVESRLANLPDIPKKPIPLVPPKN
ncbi:tetratricopeptide repeat protein [Pseudodesulfovibrio sp. JC047]|uniref:tetratricopeptide repeat protein n=1 Tax=Pseudodesulfovibrio sp. JC047 TaxID=2683199 RepID=UPI0013D4F99D|nr:tetratricopeptide repeat protein [Pseudodesulfovibrio sp. JC047]NDV19949.1 tetratricopeptide repeat protein [Pseudodesulfovibrio sp. JC047]